MKKFKVKLLNRETSEFGLTRLFLGLLGPGNVSTCKSLARTLKEDGEISLEMFDNADEAYVISKLSIPELKVTLIEDSKIKRMSTRKTLANGIHIITILPDTPKKDIVEALRKLAKELVDVNLPIGDLVAELNELTKDEKSEEEIWIEQICKKFGSVDPIIFVPRFTHAAMTGDIDKDILRKIGNMDSKNKTLVSLNLTWLPKFCKEIQW